MLHRFLGIGQTLLATAFTLLVWTHVAPFLKEPDAGQLIGYIMAGISVTMLGVAYFVLVPRVPVRDPSMPVAAYWATPELATKALRVWFVMEGAAVFAAIGFFLTALPITAIVMVFAIAAFWMTGPKVFAKA